MGDDIVEQLRLRGLHFAADKIEQLEADLAAERAENERLRAAGAGPPDVRRHGARCRCMEHHRRG